jgi:hypothetical protein
MPGRASPELRASGSRPSVGLGGAVAWRLVTHRPQYGSVPGGAGGLGLTPWRATGRSGEQLEGLNQCVPMRPRIAMRVYLGDHQLPSSV